MHVFPDYYTEFHCIADRCKHNCCIGWEIDIDEETQKKYANIGGAMGTRLRANISDGEVPHFVLAEKDRCPFLNADNLCDIICTLGEEHLCSICAKHPRFFNELPDRVEGGIGMACEEAARIILSKKTPMQLVGVRETADEIIRLRDAAIRVLQDRTKTIAARVLHMLTLCNAHMEVRTLADWAEMFLSLERLDDAWGARLCRLCETPVDLAAFARHMQGRESEYEQLVVYLIYRHFANAPDFADAAARAAFAAAAFMLLYGLGALQYAEEGKFTFEDQVELCRTFSSEVEYSDENLNILLDMLY